MEGIVDDIDINLFHSNILVTLNFTFTCTLSHEPSLTSINIYSSYLFLLYSVLTLNERTVLGGKLAAEVVSERAAGIKSTRIEKWVQESVVLKVSLSPTILFYFISFFYFLMYFD